MIIVLLARRRTGGVASGIHFHSERLLGIPRAFISAWIDGLSNGAHYPGTQVVCVTPLFKAVGFPRLVLSPRQQVSGRLPLKCVTAPHLKKKKKKISDSHL